MGTVSCLVSPKVALLYDERMCNHWDPEDEGHPESPERIRAIWNKLKSSGLSQRCTVLSAKEVEDKYLALVHTKRHIGLIKTISSKDFHSQRRVASLFNSIYFNEGSSEAAYLAAGSLIEVSERVAKGEYESAAAIIRPPGHHAEPDKAMGFCLLNNVAIATKFLLDEWSDTSIKKVLIVDWDVHHGNGTQKMFWEDPRVLFFSVHRHDFGSFYPGGDEGSISMIGEGFGRGFNINVPWEHGGYSDADYIAVWDHVLIPVAKTFNPDFIFISGGFDAASGDPLGGCCVTPHGYSVLLNKLMNFVGRRIVMALEGGYNLDALASSFHACMETLVEQRPINGSCTTYPDASTWNIILAVRQKLLPFWPILMEDLPERVAGMPSLITRSIFEAEKVDIPTFCSDIKAQVQSQLDAIQEITLSVSSLKLDSESYSGVASLPQDGNTEQLHEQNIDDSMAWRSDYSRIEIWYACFGSNMWMPRFLCYIKGGQVEGMRRACCGSKDPSLPKDRIWKSIPHCLFFGRSSTLTWGPGGVAFLHPEFSRCEKARLCLYRITLEQFNDILLQENCMDPCVAHPLFTLSDLEFVAEHKSLELEELKDGWYSNVVYLGIEQDLAVLTMTCSTSDVQNFVSGALPVLPPSKEYRDVLIKGMVEGEQLSEEEAYEYIEAASSGLFI